jgi:hypothetical protein
MVSGWGMMPTRIREPFRAEHRGGLLADDGHACAVEGEVQAPSAGGRVSPWPKRGLRRWSLRAVVRFFREPDQPGNSLCRHPNGGLLTYVLELTRNLLRAIGKVGP